nr:restriction endonuclease subunit S [uncultured Campylobacter sp.]
MSSVKVVRFKELKLWSFALQETKAISSNYGLSTLGDVLVNLTNGRKFTLKDNEIYGEPTISSKTNEISVSRQDFGKIFKVKSRVKILKGDLVISKMHTQNGLFAFAKQEFASTTTFIPFKIRDELINPNFLYMLLKPTLARLVKFDSVKRETYKVDEILDLQIPLPPRPIQDKIIDDLQKIENKIKALKDKKVSVEKEIDDFIQKILGVDTNAQILNKTGVKIVQYKDLKLFDYKSNALETNEVSPDLQYKFSDFLTRKLDKVKIVNGIEYKRVTVRTKAGGLTLRDKVYGKDIGTKNQFEIKEGQFLISKIDARNGSFGIVGNELDNAIVTADFLNFEINRSIVNDKFLIMVLKTPFYVEKLSSLSSGTTGRKRINEQKFLEVNISLPTVIEQNKLIEKLSNLDRKIESLSSRLKKTKEKVLYNLI